MPDPENHCSDGADSRAASAGGSPFHTAGPSPVRVALGLAALVLLSGTAWWVFGQAVHAPFIFDDAFSVLENPSIVHLWPLVGEDGRPGPLNPLNDDPTAGRPLVNLSLALNYRFGQLDPFGYRVVNIVMHMLSAMLLWAIVGRALRLDYFKGRFDRVAGPLSFAVASVWALHPLQTETVVYVTQRTELMVGLFYLSTLYGSLRYWASRHPAGRAVWLSLSVLACVLGMCCKEVMVSVPVMVLLFERTFLAGTFRRAWRDSWPLYLGLAFGWAPLLALNYSGPRSESAGFHLDVPAYAWWFTQAKVLWMYLRLSVWPWPLVIHYEMPYLTFSTAWPWLVASSLLGIATLVLLWRRTVVGYLGAWVLVILSPTLVVPIILEVAAERRMYLPLAAIVALVIVGGYALALQTERFFRPEANRTTSAWRAIAMTTVTAIVLAAVLSAVSKHRLAAYQDELTLWQDAVVHQPEDAVVRTGLGIALCNAGRPRRSDRTFAVRCRSPSEPLRASQ